MELIKTLLSSKRPSALAKAIAEVGKANKTIHALHYLRDLHAFSGHEDLVTLIRERCELAMHLS